MKTIKGPDFNDLFYNACYELYNNPQFETESRDLKIRELLNVSLVLKNPRHRIVTFPQRSLSLKYLAGELAFYFSASNKLKFIAYYSKVWEERSDNHKTVNSCYGRKLLGDKNRHNLTQFEYSMTQLMLDRDTRKAVMIIYDKHSANLNTNDNPCTMYLQFFIRKNKLILITNMRSNDLWSRLSYNLPFFTILQELMLIRLQQEEKFNSLELGPYVHNTGSLYLYEKDFIKVKNLLNCSRLDPDYNKKQLPDITKETFEQMDKFIQAELQSRTNDKCFDLATQNLKLTDKFLLALVGYLRSEK